MRSQFAQFLDEMQHAADADGITVAARHHDVLEYYFQSPRTPQQAAADYRDHFLPRWNAITDNGKNTDTDEVDIQQHGVLAGWHDKINY